MAEIGPAPRHVGCGTCGKPVDALRAPRVRCIDSRLWFFCSVEHAESFDVDSAAGQLLSERGFEAPRRTWGLPAPPQLPAVAPLDGASAGPFDGVVGGAGDAVSVGPPTIRSQELPDVDEPGSVRGEERSLTPALGEALELGPPIAPATPPPANVASSPPPSVQTRPPHSVRSVASGGPISGGPISGGPASSGPASGRSAPPTAASTWDPPPSPSHPHSAAALSGNVQAPATLPAALNSLGGREPASRGQESQDLLLLGIAAVSGAFSIALTLAGPSAAAQTGRLAVLGAGAGVLVAQALLSPRDPRQLDRVSLLLSPVLTTVIAATAHLGGHPDAPSALTVAGAVIIASAVITGLVQRFTQPVDRGRRSLVDRLHLQARRLSGHVTEHCSADELRPGEEILVEAGELVPADGTVVAGHARIVPWLGAHRSEPRGEGEPIPAGALIEEGALRIVTGWTGSDRAWLRLTADPTRRVDLRSSPARTGYLAAQRGGVAAAGLVLLAGFALGGDGLFFALAAAAVHGAFAHAGLAELAAARMARATLEGLDHGIAFHAAEHLDEAGRATVAALCARGTVLLGEPEVAGLEPLDQLSPEELLALAAGAESAVHHPVATAVLRAARARNVRPDATRNHNPIAGLGVTAVTSSGKGLVVGSRALMLREKISVARAESRITELESMGRTSLLVAVDGRLAGILALQDGLRPGARAAVQHLLDLGVEPVLLSGDSRETTDAIARSIDIEHVRPELPAAQRGEEIRQLSEGGAVVAVIGRSPVDDSALSAADVSITLRAAAASNADWSVGLASDDVRDAARTLRIARRARDGARAILALNVVPPTLATLAVAFDLVSPAVAPCAALLGTLAAAFRARED